MSKFDLPFPELPKTNEGKRICQVVKVKPEALDEYKKVSRTDVTGDPSDASYIDS